MKQARRWLLLAAALVLLPQAAYAQKKKPKAGNATPAAAAATARATRRPPRPIWTPIRRPQLRRSATPPAGGDQTAAPAPATRAPRGGEMDICQITPDAPQCQAAKEINLGDEAKKTVRAEVYAVQQQYVIKAQRFEIQPYFAVTLNDQFVSHDAPGLALNYYITQVLAVGVNGRLVRVAELGLGLQLPESTRRAHRRAAERLPAQRQT